MKDDDFKSAALKNIPRGDYKEVKAIVEDRKENGQKATIESVIIEAMQLGLKQLRKS
jgi:hypothetical protein